MAEIRIMISYCIRGHEIEYREGGIARSRCPVCGSPIDRSRPPISLEEAQKIKEQQAAQEAEQQAARETEQQAAEEAQRLAAEQREAQRRAAEAGAASVPAGQPGTGALPGMQRPGGSGVLPGMQRPGGTGVQPGIQRPGGVGVQPGIQRPGGTGVQPGIQRPGGTGVQPGIQRTGDTGVLPGIQRAGGAGVLPGRQVVHRPGEVPGGQPIGVQRSSGSTFFLNLYGDRIPIPEEGAWIGREGLGSRWFDGNLMISRKHVYVRPNPQTGRLQVNEDKSLNGVFYSGPGGERIRMEGARMMEPGEILWIYNIPLKIDY